MTADPLRPPKIQQKSMLRNRGDTAQINVVLPVDTREWLRLYCGRKNCSQAMAVAAALWLLYCQDQIESADREIKP